MKDRMEKYITFEDIGTTPTGKTRIWNIWSKTDDSLIGQIRWHGAWKRYCFFTGEASIFEQDCLRHISEFIVERTNEHRAMKKAQANIDV